MRVGCDAVAEAGVGAETGATSEAGGGALREASGAEGTFEGAGVGATEGAGTGARGTSLAEAAAPGPAGRVSAVTADHSG